jgi:DNA-binding NarL/FixJ family response regulator
MNKIITVDDHEIFRQGLNAVLSTIPGYKVVGSFSNGKELLENIDSLTPDIILLDISMPEIDGIEASKKLIEEGYKIPILILSMYDNYEYYNILIDIGVQGFILKETEMEELKTAINTILKGDSYFSQKLLFKLVQNKKHESQINLTKREHEVLQLIARGYSTQEIADELHISFRTAERHRANLLTKTQTHSSLKLLIYAIKHNIIEL